MNRASPREARCAAVLLPAAWFILLSSAALCGGETSLPGRIDALVREIEPGTPSPRCDDAEFLRRVSIDLWGTIPTSDEARRFLTDRSGAKRAALIDRLLDHPRYAVHMARVFDVMLLERRSSDTVKQDEWDQYLFDSFSSNKPYDQLAREILAADGTDSKTRPAVKFYLERSGDPNLLTRDVGRIFFGRDLQCCQCHDHPLIEHYHQADYYGLFAFLQRGYVTVDKTKPENKDKPAYFGERADGLATFASVFDPKKTRHGTRPRLPGGVELDEPYYPVGAEYQLATAASAYTIPKYSRRARLAEETIASGNRAFRRNIANRLWAHMMGQGLFDPVDLDHPDNPPANPALLDGLADAFQAMHYDIRGFLGELARTETYQRSLELPPTLTDAARPAAARREPLTSEIKRLTAMAAAFQSQIKQTDGELDPLRKAADQIGDELAKADTKTADAKKAADAAAEAMAKTRSTLESGQTAAKALTEAAAAARAVAARLPGEKELANAAALFAARGTAIAAEAKKLAAAAPAQAEAARATARTLQTSQEESRKVAARWQAANGRLAPAARRRVEARSARERCQARLNALKSGADADESLEKYAALRAKADAAARAAQAAKDRAAIAREIASIRERLATAREHELEFEKAFVIAGGDLSATGRIAPDFDSTALEAALRDAAGADAGVRKAEGRAKADSGAAETERTIVARQWTSRFAVASLKSLSPEQLGWNVMQSAGVVDATRAAVTAEVDKKQPRSSAATDRSAEQTRARRIEWETDRKLRGPLARFVTLFGSGAGQPQRTFFATVDQALFFANGGEVRGWLAPSGTNLSGRLLKIDNPRILAEELYLSVLTRLPSADESADIQRYVSPRSKDRSAAVQEVAWALLTSSEFRFNH